MDWTQIKEYQDETMNSTFQNTGASHFERVKYKSFVVHWTAPSDKKTINETLHEPLKIDKLSDIYLDSFMTWHSTTIPTNGVNDSAFVLKINEFDMDNNSTDNISFNKLLIPNAISTAAVANTRYIHKGKKLNYICSVNPSTITKITGEVTGLTSGVMFAVGDRFIAEFIVVARE
tara:strand:- start:41 stop:565 length:525 start_codon:yes stop_codon:yes gene_type:complete